MSKVFVIGGTGSIGHQVVQGLLKKGVPTTVLARDPSKAASIFGNSELLNVVEGDYDNIDNYKNAIAGHERLFFIVASFDKMAKYKHQFASLAYAAGVKQVVDVSNAQRSSGYRANAVNWLHLEAEQAVLTIPNRGFYVALRPSGFFTNQLRGDVFTIKAEGVIVGSLPGDRKKAWISPSDIALLAINVLTDAIEKNKDAVYDMTSEMLSDDERAKIFSRVLGKDIKHIRISAVEEYNNLMRTPGMPHIIAYNLTGLPAFGDIDYGLPVALGKEPQSMEEWIILNKDKFL
ncbi:hypothetical protein INT43_000097 [Umbelopsis isabellina]|uniref:NmrA-like domain-containing protein n=1 Tax=Mortierella isabellina TaxID=91625 RepID=A0A8H7PFJ4_MORIS|nr:hypothetical protein INT43_000097 [Umbelopsis isabellina]